MLFSPDHTWQWFYDKKHQRLALAFGEEWMFLSAFNSKQVNPDCLYQRPFSAQHAEFYHSCIERLRKQVDGHEEALAQTALNMVAAKFFAIPMMPKSWFFETSNTIVYATVGKTVSLTTQYQQAQFIVIDASEQASLLMLVDDACKLSNSKNLSQFDLIKVMNDRLMPSKARTGIAIAAA